MRVDERDFLKKNRGRGGPFYRRCRFEHRYLPKILRIGGVFSTCIRFADTVMTVKFIERFVSVFIRVYQWFNLGLVKLNARTKKFLVVIRQSPLAWVLWMINENLGALPIRYDTRVLRHFCAVSRCSSSSRKARRLSFCKMACR